MAKKKILCEWAVTTLMCFFLYDLIWIFSDFKDFKANLDGEDIHWLLVDFAYCVLFSLTSVLVNHGVLAWYRKRRHEYNRANFLLCGAIVLAGNLLVAGLCELIVASIDADFIQEDIWGCSYLFGLIASMTAFMHMTRHYAAMVIRQHEENIRLQKKYLKLQLDPHFVFNSLGSLAGMVAEDPERAEQYVVRLSHIYRHILQHLDNNYITIREAIDFAQDYVSLLNMRYDDNIVLQTDGASGQKNEYILALSVQLLIENAVKHNYPHAENLLYIRISREGGMLQISNNRIYVGDRNDQSLASYGIGIENLRQRYRLECGEEPSFLVTRDSFIVELPIIRKDEESTDYRG